MKAPFVDLSSTEYKRLLNAGLVWALFIWILGLSYFAIKYQWGNDFSHFWVGARTLLEGGDPYYQLFSYPETGTNAQDFHPLPWVAIIFRPLAFFTFPTAKLVWTILNLGLLVISLSIVYILGRETLPVWGLCLICIAIAILAARTIACGQLGILILAACLLGFKLFKEEKWILSGLFFGLTLIKPWIVIGTLLAIGVVAILKLRWKFFLGFMFTSLSLLVTTTVVWPNWWEHLQAENYIDSIGVWKNGILVEYWPLANLFDFLHVALGLKPSLFLDGYILVNLGLSIFSLGIVVFYFWYKGKIPTLVILGVFTVLSMLIVPYYRYYDYVIVSIWLIGVFMGLSEMKVDYRWFIVIALLFCMAIILNWGPHPESWVYQMLIWFYLASWLAIYAIKRKTDQLNN